MTSIGKLPLFKLLLCRVSFSLHCEWFSWHESTKRNIKLRGTIFFTDIYFVCLFRHKKKEIWKFQFGRIWPFFMLNLVHGPMQKLVWTKPSQSTSILLEAGTRQVSFLFNVA